MVLLAGAVAVTRAEEMEMTVAAEAVKAAVVVAAAHTAVLRRAAGRLVRAVVAAAGGVLGVTVPLMWVLLIAHYRPSSSPAPQRRLCGVG